MNSTLMTIQKKFWGFCLTAIIGSTPSIVIAASESNGDVHSAIQAQNSLYMAAYRAGDAAAIAKLHTEDAIIMAPNRPRIQGLENIKSMIAKDLLLGPSEIGLNTVEVTTHGDTAYEIGQYTMSIKVTDGEPIKDHGDYLVIWKRGSDGVWRLHIDIWNTNTPLE